MSENDDRLRQCEDHASLLIEVVGRGALRLSNIPAGSSSVHEASRQLILLRLVFDDQHLRSKHAQVVSRGSSNGIVMLQSGRTLDTAFHIIQLGSLIQTSSRSFDRMKYALLVSQSLLSCLRVLLSQGHGIPSDRDRALRSKVNELATVFEAQGNYRHSDMCLFVLKKVVPETLSRMNGEVFHALLDPWEDLTKTTLFQDVLDSLKTQSWIKIFWILSDLASVIVRPPSLRSGRHETMSPQTVEDTMSILHLRFLDAICDIEKEGPEADIWEALVDFFSSTRPLTIGSIHFLVHREVPLSRAIEWRDALGDLEEVFDERNSQFAAPESLRQVMPSNESPYNPKEQRLWNEKCLGPRVGNEHRALWPGNSGTSNHGSTREPHRESQAPSSPPQQNPPGHPNDDPGSPASRTDSPRRPNEIAPRAELSEEMTPGLEHIPTWPTSYGDAGMEVVPGSLSPSSTRAVSIFSLPNMRSNMSGRFVAKFARGGKRRDPDQGNSMPKDVMFCFAAAATAAFVWEIPRATHITRLRGENFDKGDILPLRPLLSPARSHTGSISSTGIQEGSNKDYGGVVMLNVAGGTNSAAVLVKDNGIYKLSWFDEIGRMICLKKFPYVKVKPFGLAVSRDDATIAMALGDRIKLYEWRDGEIQERTTAQPLESHEDVLGSDVNQISFQAVRFSATKKLVVATQKMAEAQSPTKCPVYVRVWDCSAQNTEPLLVDHCESSLPVGDSYTGLSGVLHSGRAPQNANIFLCAGIAKSYPAILPRESDFGRLANNHVVAAAQPPFEGHDSLICFMTQQDAILWSLDLSSPSPRAKRKFDFSKEWSSSKFPCVAMGMKDEKTACLLWRDKLGDLKLNKVDISAVDVDRNDNLTRIYLRAFLDHMNMITA